MNSIGIIGFGNMGEAFAKGLKAAMPDLALHVMEGSAQRTELAKNSYGAAVFDDPAALCAKSDVLLLAVKPQSLAALAESLRPHCGQIPIISIAAGVSLSRLEELFASKHISRFMPSLAASVGKSVTSVSFSASCSTEFRSQALEVANAVGRAYELPESLVPAVIGVSGSGIAFVYQFVQSMVMAGVKEGLSYAAGLDMALQVIEGAAASLREASVTPAEMVSRVCSPGGTTIEGMISLAHSGFDGSVMSAVAAAAQKSRDLESGTA